MSMGVRHPYIHGRDIIAAKCYGGLDMKRLFRNTKIKTLLISAFIMMAVITGVVGGVGLYSLNSVSSIGSDVVQRQALPMLDMLSFIESIQSGRSTFRSILLTTDDKITAKLQDEMDDIIKTANDTMAQMHSKLDSVDSKESKLLDDITSALDTYRDKRNEILDANKAGNNDQVMTLLFGDDFDKVEDNLLVSVKALKDYSSASLNDYVERQADIGMTSTLILIVIISLAVALAIALGLIIPLNITHSLSELMESIKQITNGDLTVQVDNESKNEIGILGDEINTMVTELRDVMGMVTETSNMVDDAAKQVASSSMSLAQVSTEQASSSEQISASITQIAAQTKANADSANRASALSDATRKSAERGNERMSEMLKAMNAINNASVNISNIIKVIDDIAFQTNILSLNAAVEAARAGQHGKGFAVVAEEVRSLATRSAKAASETTQMIADSTREVTGGMQIANETAKSLNDIVEGITKSAELIEGISTASVEQSQGISQVNIGIDQVSQAIQTTSSVAEESASASSELSTHAADLKAMISRFKIESEAGLGKSRKAIGPSGGGKMSRPKGLMDGGFPAVAAAGAGAGSGSSRIDINDISRNDDGDKPRGSSRISLNDTEFSKY